MFVANGFSGLSKRTTSEGLREAFEKFGQVIQGICLSPSVFFHGKPL